DPAALGVTGVGQANVDNPVRPAPVVNRGPPAPTRPARPELERLRRGPRLRAGAAPTHHVGPGGLPHDSGGRTPGMSGVPFRTRGAPTTAARSSRAADVTGRGS